MEPRRDERRAYARKAGPDTSKRAARKVKIGRLVDKVVTNVIEWGTSTGEAVWLRIGGNQTSVTSAFNQALILGKLVCIRRRGVNRSGHKALLWREADPPESRFLIDYNENLDQISADTILARLTDDPAFLDWLEDNRRHMKGLRHYWKWVRFRVELRNIGILAFMDRYDNDRGDEWEPFVWKSRARGGEEEDE